MLPFDFIESAAREIKIGKSNMARGGYRPGAGRPRGAKSKAKPVVVAATAKRARPRKTIVEVAPAADAPASDTPLGYMLSVMNDNKADEVRRDRMAVAAAPFMHPRMADNRVGKKDGQKDAAARAGRSGRFAAPAPPKLVVNNAG